MQVANASAERATLLAKTYHNKLTTNPNERSHLYQVVLMLQKKNFRQAEIYTTENKLSRWQYIAKSTLNETCCDIKIYHNQKLYKLFFVCL